MYDHQVFMAPPEQKCDFVMTATKALMKRDWKKCNELLCLLEVWNLIAGDNSAKDIKVMLSERVKQMGLLMYLLAFSLQYDSHYLIRLCEMFDMEKNEVHPAVSKMMINQDLVASWDQPTETIAMRKVEPSVLRRKHIAL